MNKPQIVLCGSIAIDRIMSFTGRYRELIKPDKLDVLSLSQLLDKLEDLPGGIGANIAHNLALLGEQPILLGSVGPDAQVYITALRQTGVDVSHIHTSHLATASFNVITDIDGNQVGGFYPGAMGDSETLSFKQWQGQDILAVIAAHDPQAMNRQVSECAELNIPYVYDPGQQVGNNGTDVVAALQTADIVLVNEYERVLLAERLAVSNEALAQKLPMLITTLGEKGSIIEGRSLKHAITVAIANPTQVVDPTGAGDGFRAGFLYGYLRQWELRKCGQLGSTVASFIVEQTGTQQALPKPAIIARYKANFNEGIEL